MALDLWHASFLTVILVVCGAGFHFLFRRLEANVRRSAVVDAAMQLGDGVVVVDTSEKIVDANLAFGAIVQMNRPDIVGRSIRELIEAIRDRVSNVDVLVEVTSASRPGRPTESATTVSLAGPLERIYRVIVWPILGRNGRSIGRVIGLRDVTVRRRAEDALKESEERYRDLFENANDIIFSLDWQGNFTSLNRAGEKATGYSLGSGNSLNLAQVMRPDQLALARNTVARNFSDSTPSNYELEIMSKDGSPIMLEINSRIVFADGMRVGVQGIARDVTEARALTARLAQHVADLGAIHETVIHFNSVDAQHGLLRETLLGIHRLTAADHAFLLVQDAMGTAFVTTAELDKVGETSVSAIPRAICQVSKRIMKGCEPRFVADAKQEKEEIPAGVGENVRSYAGLPLRARDRLVGILYVTYEQTHDFSPDSQRVLQIITSHAAVAIANSQLFEETRGAAITDSLTGLPNHRHLMDRLDYEIERARRNGRQLSVMMIDVDNFKLVNDTYGHIVGDELLRQVSGAVRGALRSTDVVGRYGGDEFLVLLPETNRSETEGAAGRVMNAVRAIRFQPVHRDSSRGGMVNIPVHVSIGTAVYPLDSSVRLELISLADSAMSNSKGLGGDAITLAQATDSGFLAAQNSTFSVLEGLLNAVDAKDKYTKLHSERVAQYALALAQVLQLGAEDIRHLRIASLLHDVGKVGIPDRILKKPGPLTREEYDVVCQHPLLGEMIIREVPQLAEIMDAVRHHHERYDGAGYPRGLRGEEIPLLARMIAVADAFSAMTVDRPYRRAMSWEEAVAQLRDGSASQFDPELVDAFIRCLPAIYDAEGRRVMAKSA